MRSSLDITPNASCVTLGIQIAFSGSQILHLQREIIIALVTALVTSDKILN